MFIYLLPRCLSVIGGEKITCAIRLEAAAMMRSFIQKVSISTFLHYDQVYEHILVCVEIELLIESIEQIKRGIKFYISLIYLQILHFYVVYETH